MMHKLQHQAHHQLNVLQQFKSTNLIGMNFYINFHLVNRHIIWSDL